MTEAREQQPSSVDGPEITLHLAYGEAAFMLLDSVMLQLIERKIMSAEDLVSAVETAIATKRQMVRDNEHVAISAPAAGLLTRLAVSLAAHAKPPE